MKTKQRFTSIERHALEAVSGGAARVASTSGSADVNQQLQLMLTSIGDSIKELANSKNNSGDQLMPMMMMMMMMGGGSSGGGAAAAPPPPQPAPAPTPTYVRVNVRR